jgi:prefoldin alpha subunit
MLGRLLATVSMRSTQRGEDRLKGDCCLSRACRSIVPENVGTPIMVPITQSLYVRGSLANADSVMVDVGTGYYVEKTVKLAEDYLTRKVKWCQENSGRLEVNILDKRKNVDAVTTVMQMKMQQQQQAAAAK